MKSITITQDTVHMSKREDIKDGSVAETEKYGLVYTRKCGWIDLGHANPDGMWGVLRFWREMNFSSMKHCNPYRGPFPSVPNEEDYFQITYKQTMCLRHKVCKSLSRKYWVKRRLSLDELHSAALTIFMEVSYGFESLQAGFPYNLFTDSGFSAEDLVSDLISFYRAVSPVRKYIELCQPVSQAQALTIWDKFGPVGSYKNKSFRPLLFPVDGDEGGITSPTYGELPGFLNTIRPMPRGFDLRYSDW